MNTHILKLASKTLATGSALLLLMAGGCASSNPPSSQNSPAPTEPAPTDPTQNDPPPTTAQMGLPAISGGTLLLTSDDSTAVAADPDRNAVWLVDLAKKSVRARVATGAGSEPGRVVEDGDGMIHVALRSGGSVLKLNPQTGAAEANRAVCPAPRGLAYDKTNDNLHVACAGGELVTLKARDGSAVRRLVLDRDLRDVVVKGDHLLVSRFRSAELLDLDASGHEVSRLKPRTTTSAKMAGTASPTVAWRLVDLPGDEVLMLHQRSADSIISTMPGGYSNGGGKCAIGGIVIPGLTTYHGTMSGGTAIGDGLSPMMITMAVDVAVSRDGQQIALVSPSDQLTKGASPLGVYRRSNLTSDDFCVSAGPLTAPPSTQLTAGAFDSTDKLYVQSRNPAQIIIPSTGDTIPLTGAENVADEGHRLFHTPTQGLIACASCHPEAGEDGHLWVFSGIGPRRTQDLRGGILATAPFHWDGDQTSLSMLMQTVFSGRMAGPQLDDNQIAAVGAWLDKRPTLPVGTPSDPAAVSRGDALFHSAALGCATCHSGTHFTSNQTVDVGTGGPVQVPSLLDVASRAPYIHTGCATTLRDRFDPACGGGDRHGTTSQLSTNQIDDLVAYLETL